MTAICLHNHLNKSCAALLTTQVLLPYLLHPFGEKGTLILFKGDLNYFIEIYTMDVVIPENGKNIIHHAHHPQNMTTTEYAELVWLKVLCLWPCTHDIRTEKMSYRKTTWKDLLLHDTVQEHKNGSTLQDLTKRAAPSKSVRLTSN